MLCFLSFACLFLQVTALKEGAAADGAGLSAAYRDLQGRLAKEAEVMHSQHAELESNLTATRNELAEVSNLPSASSCPESWVQCSCDINRPVRRSYT